MKMYNNLGVCAALLQRELRSTSYNHLEETIKNKLIQNIAENIFSSREIEIQRHSQLSNFNRCCDFLAFKEGSSTSLWNISQGSKVWECSDDIYQNYSFMDLLVDKKGFVAKIYSTGEISGYWNTQKLHIEIWFEGNKEGSFFFQSKISYLQLVNGFILGIGVNNSTLSNQKLSFYEFDQKGNKKEDVLLPELQEYSIRKMTINEDFCAIYIRDQQGLKVTSKIFIFDLKKQIHRTFDLGWSDGSLEIQSIFMLKDRLIIASNKTEVNTEYAMKIISDPKITVINITTEKIENEYLLNTRTIEKLIANEEQVIFVAYNICKKGRYLFTIDVLTGDQNAILKIPYTIDSRGHNNDEDLNLSLDGDFLTVCYPTGCVNGGSAIQTRAVINIKNRELVQKDKYGRFRGTSMTFQSGILLISKIFNNNLSLYVENFNCLYSERCDTSFRISSLQ